MRLLHVRNVRATGHPQSDPRRIWPEREGFEIRPTWRRELKSVVFSLPERHSSW